MRMLVVADVHANLVAFEAVLEDARRDAGFEEIWSLGDIVGYGPEPNACIALLQSYEHRAIAGNHDLAAIGAVSTEDFNPTAAAAVHWTAEQLGEGERAWLGNLGEVVIEGDFTLVHGSLTDPIWEYLVHPDDASAHFQRQQTPYALVGHSHLPLVYIRTPDGVTGAGVPGGETLPLKRVAFVANPGSVGQPRDGDARAAYALIDTETVTVEFRRVEYDIARTQTSMVSAGLPRSLVERLSHGR